MFVVFLSSLALLISLMAFARAAWDRVVLSREIIRLETQLQTAQHLLKRRSYLASEIAHDIKNPLTAILCSAEALDLMIGPSLEPTHQKSLRYICDYGDQLLRLLSDFLDISKIQTGHLESKKSPVVVPELCQAIVGLLEAVAQRKQVQIVILAPELLPQAWIDPGHLKQILFNLIHNAIKFSFEDSQVTIAIKVLSQGNQILIEVSDRGPGIPLSKQQEIFNPYAHFDSPSALGHSTEGVGLGLALCRSLIELEGGTIDVYSVPGEGALFSLKVPIYNGLELATGLNNERQDNLENLSLKDKKVLLLDSDRGARESMGLLITALGGILDASNGVEDALRDLPHAPYDAIVVEEGAANEISKLVAGKFVSERTKIICSSTEEGRMSDGDGEIGLKKIEKPICQSRLIRAFDEVGG